MNKICALIHLQTACIPANSMGTELSKKKKQKRASQALAATPRTHCNSDLQESTKPVEKNLLSAYMLKTEKAIF